MTDKKASTNSNADEAAVNLIRSRISKIYGGEPNAKIEIEEVGEIKKQKLSKHQEFVKKLSSSGKSAVEVQTEWHKYYQALPDNEKHEVWQEFYAATDKLPEQTASTQKENTSPVEHPPKKTHIYEHQPDSSEKPEKQTIASLKRRVTKSAHKHAGKKLSAKAHFKSLLFGLGMGLVVLLVIMFSFFNERFIAPFITPSKNVSSTPIIIDPNSTAAGNETLVIIPKINVEVPVVYDAPSIKEADIQKSLEDGVVHYITTPNPGEVGNSVIVGHSSNNIFNHGKYKFAFVLLNQVEVGDTFSLTKNGKRYVYRVYKKDIVKPTDVTVLGAQDKEATATLITCDPPGTSLNRLIIVGEQISPNPNDNKASTAVASTTQPSIVPGNAPSLWSRIVGWFRS